MAITPIPMSDFSHNLTTEPNPNKPNLIEPSQPNPTQPNLT